MPTEPVKPYFDLYNQPMYKFKCPAKTWNAE